MAKAPLRPKSLRVDTLTHDEATRRNAPTAELEAFVPPSVKEPIAAAYQQRNPDLDPQLVWRGKDALDWSDLVVEAPPLYIQEKVHPKALIEALRRYSSSPSELGEEQIELFADLKCCCWPRTRRARSRRWPTGSAARWPRGSRPRSWRCWCAARPSFRVPGRRMRPFLS